MFFLTFDSNSEGKPYFYVFPYFQSQTPLIPRSKMANAKSVTRKKPAKISEMVDAIDEELDNSKLSKDAFERFMSSFGTANCSSFGTANDFSRNINETFLVGWFGYDAIKEFIRAEELVPTKLPNAIRRKFCASLAGLNLNEYAFMLETCTKNCPSALGSRPPAQELVRV